MSARHSSSKSKADVLPINNLSSSVQLPGPNVDINEWYATHIVLFYNELSLLCAILRHDNVICNETDCPKMTAGSESEYLWHSDEFIQPVAVSAPKYIDFLMEWIEESINDHELFPRLDHDDTKDNEEDDNWIEQDTEKALQFPKKFRSLASKICRRMGRVYGHIYHAHWQAMIELKLTQYVNTSFQYFLYFVLEHQLVKEREFQPMKKVVKLLYRDADR